MTNAEKKAYLKSYKQAFHEAKEAEKRLYEFRERNAGLKAIVIDDMPHSSGGKRDLSDYVAQLDEMEETLGDAWANAVARQKMVIGTISRVPDDFDRRLLSMIYLDWLTIAQISEATHYSYRQIVRAHRDALERLVCP